MRQTDRDRHTARRHLDADRPRLGLPVLLGSLGINTLALALPLVLLQIFDRVIPFQSHETLMVLFLGLLAALALDFVLKLCRLTIIGAEGETFERSLARRSVACMLGADPAAFEGARAGVHLDRDDAITALREFYAGQARLLKIDLPFTLGFVAMIYLIGGWLVLVPVACVCVLLVFRLILRSLQAPVLRARSSVDERRYSFLSELLFQIVTVKGYGMETQLLRRYEVLQAASAAASRRLMLVTQFSHAFGAVFSQAAVAAMGLAGAWLAIAGHIGTAELAACMLLNGRTVQPMLKMLGFWVQVETSGESRRKLLDLFETPQRPDCGFVRVIGALVLDDVVVRHDARVLATGVCANVAPGGCLAITGADGTGKTTLMRMILGEIGDGAGITLDGRAPAAMAASRGHRGIVYVDRNPVIFEGTIRENLSLFGDADAIDRALAAAARIGLDEDICRLPHGYDTMLYGDATMTRGWLQRIAIARAFALEPRILILNDANTSLDHGADAAVLRELARLRGEVTLVLGTARPSWIALADRIVDLDDQALREVALWKADRAAIGRFVSDDEQPARQIA